MATVYAEFRIGGVLTNITSATLADALNAYGVKRNDTGAVVVPSGTAMLNVGPGIYSYTFTDPAVGLTYTASIKYVRAGVTDYTTEQLVGVGVSIVGTVTVNGVIDRVRLALNDPASGARWPTGNLTNYVNDGVAEICARRPELRVAASGVLSAVSIGVLPPELLHALVAFVCGKALSEDDPDKMNAERAGWYMEAFEENLYVQ